MKLFRDVLQATGFADARGEHGRGRRSSSPSRARARPRPDGHAASRASTASRRSRGCAADERTAVDPGARADGAGDGRRPRAVPSRRASTATSRSRSNVSGAARASVGEHYGRPRWLTSGRREILVVDDMPENVRLLEAVLAPRGYEVLTASDGEHGAARSSSEQPDLILLDVVMPGLDGYAVCRRLRADEETAVLPVIMVTSSIGQEKTKAIEAGADDFIPKPFNHDELLDAGAVAAPHQALPRHDQGAGRRARRAEPDARGAGRRSRSTSSSGCGGCGGSSRPSSRTPSSPPATSRSSRVTAGRSPMFFADLRGWTSFVDAVEPEELMRVLREFHDVDRPARQAVRRDRRLPRGRRRRSSSSTTRSRSRTRRCARCGSACALREEMAELTPLWRKRGYELELRRRHRARLRHLRRGRLRGAVGLRRDRRGDESRVAVGRRGDGGQILIAQRLYAEVEDRVEAEPAGEYTLKGFPRPVAGLQCSRCSVRSGDVWCERRLALIG